MTNSNALREQVSRFGTQHARGIAAKQTTPIGQISVRQRRIGDAIGAQKLPEPSDDVVHNCFHVDVACAMVSPALS